jgi:flavin reductase (DIM6/NTAB) family NADH-FMN oxidoreductase RutF
MNICTYVTPVSMKPKRYLLGIYENTQTLANLEVNKQLVLQILQDNQYNLIRLLGQQSGKKVDKIRLLNKRKLLTDWEGYPVLRDSLAVLKLKAIREFDGGDHRCFLCDVVTYKNTNEGKALDLDLLKKKKLIRS